VAVVAGAVALAFMVPMAIDLMTTPSFGGGFSDALVLLAWVVLLWVAFILEAVELVRLAIHRETLGGRCVMVVAFAHLIVVGITAAVLLRVLNGPQAGGV
jgi:hypothetical protein